MMFLLKKILGGMLKPLPLSALIALIGFYLLLFSRKHTAAKMCLSMAVIIAIGCSSSFVANALIYPLENQYPAINNIDQVDGVEYIVVLGGGHAVSENIPVTSHLSNSSTNRLLEALRLWRQLPEAKLILSGGAVYSDYSEADTMAALLKALTAINDQNLVIENRTKDTAAQAKAIKSLVGEKKFLLVTSAAHMPRSMWLMQQQGLQPIAAPAHFRYQRPNYHSPGTYLPSGHSLGKSEAAIHEYLGLLWEKLRLAFGEFKS